MYSIVIVIFTILFDFKYKFLSSSTSSRKQSRFVRLIIIIIIIVIINGRSGSFTRTVFARLMTVVFPCRAARWRKPLRETLATPQYFADFRAEQCREGDDHIVVYRGLGEDGLPGAKTSQLGSLKNSLIARLTPGGGGGSAVAVSEHEKGLLRFGAEPNSGGVGSDDDDDTGVEVTIL